MRSRILWSRTRRSPSTCSRRMMMRFQEDTVRHLFRMQIIGPDGSPIDPDGPLPPWMQSQQTLDLPPAETVSSTNASASQQSPQANRRRLRRRLFHFMRRQRSRRGPRRRRSTRWSGSSTRRSSGSSRQRARAGAASASNGGHLPRRSGEKIGRNDDCPCGSGKKYKKCHGADA